MISSSWKMLSPYGQIHKLALQQITDVLSEPPVWSGDSWGFHLFPLKVQALVGMLEQLGKEGRLELECGLHVTRLLSKLPFFEYSLSGSSILFSHQCRPYQILQSGSSTKSVFKIMMCISIILNNVSIKGRMQSWYQAESSNSNYHHVIGLWPSC